MIKRILILISFFCLIIGNPITFAQLVVTGVVYEDLNENGVLDQDEPGISNVVVSNGAEVVLTNEKGKYEISIDEKDATIFVIKPEGYQLPVNEQNQPQFYYIHKPEGSPKLEYEGVAPTGPLPESVNFPLVKSNEQQEYKVLLFGDPQPYSDREVGYFDRDIVYELIDTEEYKFGITLGDIVGDNLNLYEPYNKSVSKIGVPWFNVYGNHDMNFDAEKGEHADETFEATFGPATYSFNYGKAHFIILDDVIYPREHGESGYIGGFTNRQLQFIENNLKYVPKDKLVVLAFHIPLFLTDGWGETFRLEDRTRLFELLKGYPNTITLSAHTHFQTFHFFGQEEGWQRLQPHIQYNVGTTNGDWWSGDFDERGIPETLMRDGTPNGYGILNIDGNQFTIDYKVANMPKDYTMSVWGPKIVPQKTWHNAELYVNFFLGNEYTQVEYKLPGDNEEWQKMQKVMEHDPYVEELRQKWDNLDTLPELGARPSNPVESSHIWKAGVPTNLPLGKQIIQIKVTDMFGRSFKENFSYDVVKPNYQR